MFLMWSLLGSGTLDTSPDTTGSRYRLSACSEHSHSPIDREFKYYSAF